MQILLLQDENIEVRDKVNFFLESTYGATVQEANKIGEGVTALKTAQHKFDLIILDTKTGTAGEIEEFWKLANDIPMLLCVQGGPNGASLKGNIAGLLDRALFMESVISSIDTLIEKGTLKVSKSEQGQVRIRTKLLLSVCPLKGDIYIRLSVNKFVKLFREGDTFDLQDLEKYTVKKGVEYLYIRQEQCQEFALKYREQLHTLLKSDKQLTIEETGKLGDSVHETVQELCIQVGFTKEVQELTKTHVQLTVKSMGKDPDLAEILKKLDATQNQYISSHSTLCAYLACGIASQLQWGSDTTFYKLSLASFLHDITLSNNELAEMTTLEELEAQGKRFNEKEIKEFKEHPAVAAEMAKKMTEVPPDVDMIIRQHHERPDGSGFPRKLTHAYIAPLASVFIVSHDLTRYVFKVGEHYDIQEFLKSVKDKYKSSQFKKVLGCLEMLQKIKGLSAAIKQQQSK